MLLCRPFQYVSGPCKSGTCAWHRWRAEIKANATWRKGSGCCWLGLVTQYFVLHQCCWVSPPPPPLFCYLHYIFRSSGGLDCIRMLSHADVVICLRRQLGNTIERTPHLVVVLPLLPETPCFDCNKIAFISFFCLFF